MRVFVVGHMLRLRDGTIAVRSLEYPECEGRDPNKWPAREQFRRAVGVRVHAMLEQGFMPSVCCSNKELTSVFSAQCKIGIEAADRLPNGFDYTVIEGVTLSPDAAERLIRMRADRGSPDTDSDDGPSAHSESLAGTANKKPILVPE